MKIDTKTAEYHISKKSLPWLTVIFIASIILLVLCLVFRGSVFAANLFILAVAGFSMLIGLALGVYIALRFLNNPEPWSKSDSRK